MKRFKQVTTKTEYGWSDWQQPVMNNYLMKCCDCGLVHVMNFRVIRIDTARTGTILPKDKFQVQLKARRSKKYN